MRQQLADALAAMDRPTFTWDRKGRGETPRVYAEGRYCLAIDTSDGQPYIARVVGVKRDWNGRALIGYELMGYPYVTPSNIEIVDRFRETSTEDN